MPHPVLNLAATSSGDELHLADWDHDGVPDLFFVRKSNTASGFVEVEVHSGLSGMQLFNAITTIPVANGLNYNYDVLDWDGDGVPDLVELETAGTASGMVEVHVRSGAVITNPFQTPLLDVASSIPQAKPGQLAQARVVPRMN
jgi:hypothetical protein